MEGKLVEGRVANTTNTTSMEAGKEILAMGNPNKRKTCCTIGALALFSLDLHFRVKSPSGDPANQC
jgi:hypothetical protein